MHEDVVESVDPAANSVGCADIDAEDYLFGDIRWLDGPATGLRHRIIALENDSLVLDGAIPAGVAAGTRAQLHEGCDRTIATCASRFDNAINFRGEPFLPGNDLVARYPSQAS